MKKIIFSILMACCEMPVAAQIYPPAVYEVDNLEMFQEVITHRGSDGKSYAEIKLTADLYLSDLSERNFVNTFCGTIDGNGHTIWAARPEVQHDGGGHYKRQYLFTYSDGATFKNLQFKNIRVQSDEHDNMCIITSHASNCTFENITFDNVSTWTNEDNAGAAVGYAQNSTFTNIKVINSDFTVDGDCVGSVAGYADKCVFSNIEVTNSETFADNDWAGGVVGSASSCIFTHIAVHSGHFALNGKGVGGVAGMAANGSTFANCVVGDQVSLFGDGALFLGARVGGIVGCVEGDGSVQNCINSAIVMGDQNSIGGIVGTAYQADTNFTITGCLNTGLIVTISSGDVSELSYKYKNKQLPCESRYYNGTEYAVRLYDGDFNLSPVNVAGIAGSVDNADIKQCTNFGGVYAGGQTLETYVGGIVAQTQKESSIIDCLADYRCSSFCADLLDQPSKKGTTITNCLANNKYYGNVTCYDGETKFSHWGTDVNVSELASGEFLAKLGANWEQNLGTDRCPTPTGNRGLYHTRKVSNEYGTACFPFPVKSDGNVRFYMLEKVSNDGDAVTLSFVNVETLEAGSPALIRVAEQGDYTFVQASDERRFQPFSAAAAVGQGWYLKGTFDEKVFDGDAAKSIYYISDGKIKNAKKTTVAPYRAYFDGPSIDELAGSVTSEAKSIRFVLEDEDGSTTAIELVGDDLVPVQKSGKTYSLMGTEVGEGYRGIVIRNGKKVLLVK